MFGLGIKGGLIEIKEQDIENDRSSFCINTYIEWNND